MGGGKLGIEDEAKYKERELGSYGEDTQNGERERGRERSREAPLRYGKLKANIGRKISLGIGAGELRENPNDWAEDRRIMPTARESSQVGLTGPYRPFWRNLEMGGRNTRFRQMGSNLGDLGLVRIHSVATNDKKDPQIEISEESGTEATAISNLGRGGDSEIPSDADIHVSAVNKVRRTHDSERETSTEREADVPQSLTILEYIVLDKTRGSQKTNENAPIVHEKSVSKIEEAAKMQEFCRAIGRNAPKSEKGQEIADRREFVEDWGEVHVDWNIGAIILEGEVDGRREMGTHELEESKRGTPSGKSN